MPIPAGPGGDPTLVSLDDAKLHLNIDLDDHEDDDELQFFVDAANEWVATRVTDTAPTPVQLAIRELVRELWETQRGPVAGDLDLDTGTSARTGLKVSIPPRVRALLGPYMKDQTAVSSFPPVMPLDGVQQWSRW